MQGCHQVFKFTGLSLQYVVDSATNNYLKNQTNTKAEQLAMIVKYMIVIFTNSQHLL